MSRELTPPPALAGIDLPAHRERAKRALVLFIGNDNIGLSPAEWEAKAEALLVLLERYGVAPLWVFDPSLPPGKSVIDPDLLRALGGSVVTVPPLPPAKPLHRQVPLAPADFDQLRRSLEDPGNLAIVQRISDYFFPEDIGGCA